MKTITIFLLLLGAAGLAGQDSKADCHCYEEECGFIEQEWRCESWTCEVGWNNAPYCNQHKIVKRFPINPPEYKCEELRFGINCGLTCHCPPDDTCKAINGVCFSGMCGQGYYGSSCQIRLPRLTHTPKLQDITCTSVTVIWNKWNSTEDSGDPPVDSYEVEHCKMNLTNPTRCDWVVSSNIPNPVSRVNELSYSIQNLEPQAKYYIRVRTNRDDSGKRIAGLTTDNITLTTCPTTPVPATTTTLPTTTPNPVAERITNVNITVNSTVADFVWDRPIFNEQVYLIISYNFSYHLVKNGACSSNEIPSPVSFSLTSPQHTLVDLTPYSLYRINVHVNYWNTRTTSQETSVRKTESFTTLVDGATEPMTGFGSDNITKNSFDLVWNEYPCKHWNSMSLNGYELNVFETTTGLRERVPLGRQTVYRIRDRLPNVLYVIKIRPITDQGTGPYSNELAVRTSDTLPPEAENLSATALPNHGGNITWLRVDTSISLSSYRLRYQRIKHTSCSNETPGTVFSKNVAITSAPGRYESYELDNLVIYSTYQINVSNVNSLGQGQPITTRLTTHGQAPVDGITEPVAVSITNQLSSLTFIWADPSCTRVFGDNTRYHVQAFQASRSNVIVDEEKPQSLLQITNIRSSTVYGIRVRVINDYGTGPWNDWTNATTPIDVAPLSVENVTTTSINSTSISVNWSYPTTSNNNQGASYKLLYQLIRYGDCSPIDGAAVMVTLPVLPGYTITGLLPWSTYTIIITSSNSIGSSNSTLSEIETNADVPLSNIGVETITEANGRATITWSKPSCDVLRGPVRDYGYKIAGPDPGDEIIRFVTALSAQFNVQPNAQYQISMRIRNTVQTGLFGPPYSYTAQNSAPITFNVNIDSTSATQLKISITRSPDDYSENSVYTLYYNRVRHGACTSPEQQSEDNSGSLVMNSNTETITGLDPFSIYNILVIAKNEKGSSNSTIIATTSSTSIQSIVTITDVLIGDNSSYINITYAPVPCYELTATLSMYQCQLLNNLGTELLWRQVDELINWCFIPYKLEPNTEYRAAVQMRSSLANNHGLRAFQTFKTPAVVPSQPSRPVLNDKNSTALTLRWLRDTSAGDIIEYMLIITSANSQENISIPGNKNEYLLFNLTPFTSYQIQLMSRTDAGWSPPSPALEVTTEESPSGPIGSIRERKPASTECIYLQWEPPSQANGLIVQYRIYFLQLGADESVTQAPRSNIRVNSSATQYDLCGLKPGFTYRIEISALHQDLSDGVLTIKEIATLGSPPTPLVPSNPIITLHTINIKIQPVQSTNPPINSYRIIATTDDGVEKIYAELTASAVKSDYRFILGDNRLYGGFNNTQLNMITRYSILVEGVFAEGEFRQTRRSDPLKVFTLAHTSLQLSNLDSNWTVRATVGLVGRTTLPAEVIGATVKLGVIGRPVNMTRYIERSNGSELVVDVEWLPRFTVYTVTAQLQTSYENISGMGPTTGKQIRTSIGKPNELIENSIQVIESSSTNTTITLKLMGATSNNGPITAYQIWLKRLGVSKRDIPGAEFGQVYVEISPTVFNNNAVKSDGLTQVIGNDQITGVGYRNVPLRPDTRYRVSYVVISSFENQTEYVYRSVDTQTMPTNTGEIADWMIAVIIIVVILIVIIIIIFIIFIMRWIRRGKKRRGEASDRQLMTNKTDDWIGAYQGILSEDSDGVVYRGYWSPIYDFSQKRHVVLDAALDYEIKDPAVNERCVTFEQEFNELPRGSTANSTVAAGHPELNRVEKMVAYDHSRVVILNSPIGTDYINASYIDGYNKRNQYIATTSPYSEDTVLQFWQMIYEQKTTQIVMMTNMMDEQIVKCVQYWPIEKDVVEQFGMVCVQLLTTRVCANFTLYTFKLEHIADRKPARTVTQYRYTSWPEHGVPAVGFPLLDFRQIIRDTKPKHSGPLIVHCGTGCSTSGFLIALDSLLEEVTQSSDKSVSVFKCVSRMRANRCFMVRVKKQYLLLYDSLFEYLLGGEKIISHDLKSKYKLLNTVNPHTRSSYLDGEVEQLNIFSPVFNKELCSTALLDKNLSKNRYSTVIPPDEFRVKLSLEHGTTDYINAVQVDGYGRKNHYILTQTPLHETVIDFWRMIYEYGVSSVVMMDDPFLIDESCAIYWPVDQLNITDVLDRTGGGDAMKVAVFGEFIVKLIDDCEEEHGDVCIVRHFSVSNKLQSNNPPRHVKQFQIKEWPLKGKKQKNGLGLLKIVDAVEKWQQQVLDLYNQTISSPVVVHCLDGAAHSGIFVAAARICEKMGCEEKVNVFLTVKEIKHRRKDAVNSSNQYKFLYKVLWDYISIQRGGSAGAGDSSANNNNIYSPIHSQTATTVANRTERTNNSYEPYDEAEHDSVVDGEAFTQRTEQQPRQQQQRHSQYAEIGQF